MALSIPLFHITPTVSAYSFVSTFLYIPIYQCLSGLCQKYEYIQLFALSNSFQCCQSVPFLNFFCRCTLVSIAPSLWLIQNHSDVPLSSQFKHPLSSFHCCKSALIFCQFANTLDPPIGSDRHPNGSLLFQFLQDNFCRPISVFHYAHGIAKWLSSEPWWCPGLIYW